MIGLMRSLPDGSLVSLLIDCGHERWWAIAKWSPTTSDHGWVTYGCATCGTETSKPLPTPCPVNIPPTPSPTSSTSSRRPRWREDMDSGDPARVKRGMDAAFHRKYR